MAFADALFSALFSSATNPTFTHAPAHVPKVVIVTAVNNIVASSGNIAAISYGASTLSLKSVSVDTAGEPGTAQIWSRTSTDATFSSGSVTVSVTKSSTNTFHYVCMTVAADGNITVASTHRGAENQNSSTPTVSIAKSAALRWAFGCKFDGLTNLTDSTIIVGQQTVGSTKFGSQCAHTSRESTAGTADITYGWAQAADDWALVAIAIEEVAAGAAATAPRLWRMGVLGVQ